MPEYTKRQLADLTGLLGRQVQFYFDEGIVGSVAGTGGVRGRALRFSEEQVAELFIIKELADYGMTVRRVKQIVEYLRTTQYVSKYEEAKSPMQETFLLIHKRNEEIDPKFRFHVEYLGPPGTNDVAESNALLRVRDMKKSTGLIVINLGRILRKMKR